MEKLKILLCCSAGMSTSLLVKKIIEAGAAEGRPVECQAVSAETGKQIGNDWDLIMLGPQIRYELPYFKKNMKTPVDVIPPQFYALANGKAVLEHAIKFLGAK